MILFRGYVVLHSGLMHWNQALYVIGFTPGQWLLELFQGISSIAARVECITWETRQAWQSSAVTGVIRGNYRMRNLSYGGVGGSGP